MNRDATNEKLALDGGMPVREKFLPIGRPLLGNEEKEEVLDALNSDWISKGPKTKQFEKDFREYIGSDYALAVSSCTAGLHIALQAVGVTNGDEVITSPLTFVSTCNAIIYLGAIPVLVDVNGDDFNCDVNQLEAKITPQTKVIIAVHFAGLPCDMDEIIRIAGKYNLTVIEDAAHAVGAEYKHQKIGNIGHITAFSFYATKNMTTGDGGMVTTNNKGFAKKMEILSFHGLSSDAWKRYTPSGEADYEMIEPGYKYNMTDIQAAIGIHQLRKLDSFIETRNKYATIYDRHLSELPEIVFQKNKQCVKHGRHLYPIIVNFEHLDINRDGFIRALKAENIGCGIHYKALHAYSYYRNRFNVKNNELPNASYISKRTVSLPLYPKMTEEDVYDVILAVKKVINCYKK
jgi:dTDP-4-amino-4,6-dideoxygalactose transaminase